MQILGQVLANGLFSGGVYALVAVGYALVYSVLRLVNFAQGGIVTLGAFTALLASRISDGNMAVMILATGVVAIVAGWLLERVAYRPIRQAPPLTAVVTAIGAAMVIENAIAAAFGYDAHSLPRVGLSPHVWSLWGVRFSNLQLMSLLGVAVLLTVALRVVRYSRLGRAMRAIADDSELASLSGIDSDATISQTFMLASLLGALAGLVLALDVGCDPFMGTPIGFKAFVACVAGGNSLPGAVVGGIALGLCESCIGAYVSTEFRDAIVMGVLVLILLVRPQGLTAGLQTRTV